MTNEKFNEEKAAAANYVINFYNEVQQLTHFYANYENLMLELAEKYGKEDDKVTEGEKEVVKGAATTIRYYTTVSFIKYSSIMLKTNDKVDKDIEKVHDSIIKTYIPKREDVKKYVVLLNGVLMNTVIKTLLENSSEVIAKLYGEDLKEK